MTVNDFLSRHRDAILRLWFDRVARTYPAETGRFLKSDADRFGNPVGRAILEGLSGVYDELLAGASPSPGGALEKALDRAIRIRSVQELSASKAVGFVLELKAVVRERAAAGRDAFDRGELEGFDARVDQACLFAFDVYTKCREKLHELRTGEIRRRAGRLIEDAGGPCPSRAGCRSKEAGSP